MGKDARKKRRQDFHHCEQTNVFNRDRARTEKSIVVDLERVLQLPEPHRADSSSVHERDGVAIEERGGRAVLQECGGLGRAVGEVGLVSKFLERVLDRCCVGAEDLRQAALHRELASDGGGLGGVVEASCRDGVLLQKELLMIAWNPRSAIRSCCRHLCRRCSRSEEVAQAA